MPAESCRVLLDLSVGSEGYCGIAQGARVLVQLMQMQPRLEPTGLIYSRSGVGMPFPFGQPAPVAGMLERQAQFFHQVVHQPRPPRAGKAELAPPPPPPQNLVRQAVAAARRGWRWLPWFCGKQASTELVERDLWDVVWRNVLAPSLDEADFEVAQRSRFLLSNLTTATLSTQLRWGLPGVRLDTRGFDVAVFHDSMPVRVSPGTTKIIRYYDLIPGLRPDTVASSPAIAFHFAGIRSCLHDSVYVCNSEPTRADLVRYFPALKSRAVVIPEPLPNLYFPERNPRRWAQIVSARVSDTAEKHPPQVLDQLVRGGQVPAYVMTASTIEPRKNHIGLIRAIERLNAGEFPDLKLLVVGSLGWKVDEIAQAMAPLIRQGRLLHLERVPSAELRVLYSHAQVMAFPSFYEGFGYPPLEAMCCDTPTVVSDIDCHHWTYGSAAAFCNPYRIESIAATLRQVLSDAAWRTQLVARGRSCVAQYSLQQVGNQWQNLCDALQAQNAAGDLSQVQLADLDLTSTPQTLPLRAAA